MSQTQTANQPAAGQTQQAGIRRLLAAARMTHRATHDQPAPAEFDWKRPAHFQPAQLKGLENLAGQTARAAAKLIAERLHYTLELSAGAPTQHYVAELPAESAESSDYVLPFRTGQRVVGAMAVPQARACEWVARLLGAKVVAAGEKKLSNLEESLLADMLAALASAIAQAIGRADLVPAGEAGAAELGRGRSGLADEPARCCCRFVLSAGGEKTETVATIVLDSEIAGAALPADPAGKPTGTRPGPRSSARDYRKDMQSHVQRVNAEMVVRLHASTTMRDVLSLENGDVLMTGMTINQPFEISVNGVRLASCKPVQCEGFFGARIEQVG